MPDIKITPLGAGQDVGRSCILLTMGGKNIMLDCGMHMGYNDERRFPDFSYIADGPITPYIDCVIISHFHLDHSGALPYMSEMVGGRPSELRFLSSVLFFMKRWGTPARYT